MYFKHTQVKKKTCKFAEKTLLVPRTKQETIFSWNEMENKIENKNKKK